MREYDFVTIELSKVSWVKCSSLGCEESAYGTFSGRENGRMVDVRSFCLNHLLFVFEKLVGSWSDKEARE